MGYIYIIKNDINDKVYIGQTSRSIEIRWKEHVRHHGQLIDDVIHKYGREHFYIDQVEECADEELDSREQYWINYYNSLQNGYNLTSGGKENITYTNNKVQEVLSLWEEGLTINRIVKTTKLNVETVRKKIKKNGIDHQQIKDRANIFIGAAKAKQIAQYTPDGDFIQLWPSTAEAVRNGYTRSSIQRSLKDGLSHSGYIWKGVNE